MGLVYLSLFIYIWLICMENVGRYIPYINPMGHCCDFWHQPFCRSRVALCCLVDPCRLDGHNAGEVWILKVVVDRCCWFGGSDNPGSLNIYVTWCLSKHSDGWEMIISFSQRTAKLQDNLKFELEMFFCSLSKIRFCIKDVSPTWSLIQIFQYISYPFVHLSLGSP